MDWKHENLFLFRQKKIEKIFSKEIKSEQGHSAIFLDIYGTRGETFGVLNRWNIIEINVSTSFLNHAGISCNVIKVINSFLQECCFGEYYIK